MPRSRVQPHLRLHASKTSSSVSIWCAFPPYASCTHPTHILLTTLARFAPQAFSDAFVVGKNLIEEARKIAADQPHPVSFSHLDTLNFTLDISRQYLINELSKKAAMYQAIVILDKELKMVLDHIDPVQPQDLVQP